LSVSEIHEMSSGECRYHQICNADLYEAAFQRQANIEHNDRELDKVAVQRMFDDRATPEEFESAVKETQKFGERFPQGQFKERPENRAKLVSYLREHNKAITYQNLVEAFETLSIAGNLVLSPNAISVGPEVELTGEALRKYPRLHKLLEAQKRPTAEERLSADEYFEQHKGVLADKRTPPLIIARQERAAATAAHFVQAEAKAANSGSMTVTDYGGQSRGGPPQPEKISFRKKIQNMTADEIRRECEIDPNFRAALDALK
jgi:hypothetical protein